MTWWDDWHPVRWAKTHLLEAAVLNALHEADASEFEGFSPPFKIIVPPAMAAALPPVMWACPIIPNGADGIVVEDAFGARLVCDSNGRLLAALPARPPS